MKFNSRVHRSLKNRKGQLVIEAVLLIVVTMSLTLAAVNYLRDKQLVAKFVSGPWSYVQGMSECGVWGTVAEVCKKHPNNLARSITHRPL